MEKTIVHTSTTALLELMNKGILKVNLEKLYDKQDELEALSNPTDDQKEVLNALNVLEKVEQAHLNRMYNVMCTQPLIEMSNRAMGELKTIFPNLNV